MSYYDCLSLSLTVLVCILLQSLVWADSQLILFEHPERLSFTGFGASLATVGDLDGDGVPDYVIGAYEHFWNNNLKQGRAFVFSGRKGGLLYVLDLPHPRLAGGSGATPFSGASFGWAVAAAGDIDQDGAPDILIGAFNYDESGAAYVFSGKTRALLLTLQPPQAQPSAGFGWSVASLGDLTGDKIPELIVGAFAYAGTGRAFVFNGKDGSLLGSFGPPSPEPSAFGWSVAGAGDLDGDGSPDLVIGAPYASVNGASAQGRVYAFSGRTRKLLYVLDDPSPQAGAVFGWRIAVGGDYDGDGTPEVLIGAPYQDVGKNRSVGEAFIFSGRNGSQLLTLDDPAPTKPYAGFGLALTTCPDINQDGVPEVLVGAPFQTVDQFHIQGEAFLFDGRSGTHLSTFDNPDPHQGSQFGYTVVSPGDVNGDGIADFMIGASGQTIREKAAVGRAYLFLSRSPTAPSAESLHTSAAPNKD